MMGEHLHYTCIRAHAQHLQGISSSPLKMLQVGMDFLFFFLFFRICRSRTAVIPFDIDVNMHSFYNHISLYY